MVLPTRIRLYKRALVGAMTRRVVGREVRAFVVPWSEGFIAVDPEDKGVGSQLRTTGAYEPVERDRLLSMVHESSRVLVVGAHIGAMVIPLARRVHEVVAVEANPQSLQLLDMNLALAGVQNCTLLRLAAGADRNDIEFLLSRANSGGSKRVPAIRNAMYYYDRPETIRVPAAPLDELIENKAFDLIVMDIEGSEYFALRGMPKILDASRTLVMEFLPHHLRNVAGVTVNQLLKVLPEYASMLVPSTGREVSGSDIQDVLKGMYEAELGDGGVVFSR